VKKISSIDELLLYQQFCKVEFLVQQWVSYPLELSIFYCRYPSWKSGIITSVTGKSLLSVTGNGIDTIETLIRKNDRSFLQLESLRKQKNISMNAIPAKGEKVVLVPYGNHARGALFNDYQSCINEKMVNVIDELSKKIDGFYFGRFDLLTTSLDDLYIGKNISIVELNGCGAEPIHIYESSFRFIKAQKVIWQHFRMMYDIAMENKKRGVNFITPGYFIKGWKEEKRYKKMAPADKLIISQNEKHH
jgi:microcompartment protein CcmK/EutM